MRQKVPELSDPDAIKQAVREGFTTKSRSTNKGSGLNLSLKTVVMRNGGKVTIYSGKGIVRFYREDGGDAGFLCVQGRWFLPRNNDRYQSAHRHNQG